MEKEYTEEEMKEIVAKIIEKVRKKLENDYKRTKRKMDNAEKILTATFDENQLELYKNFCIERDAFYVAAVDFYSKIY